MSPIRTINAGFYKTDGGAAFGVYPRALWEREVPADPKHRIRMAQNLLLIDSDGKRILVDTGLGNRIGDRVRKVYDPEEYSLFTELEKLGLTRHDIDIVVFTHLHFDHVGGLISDFGSGDELTFPNALHIAQKAEWDMAYQPDELNRAAYDFPGQIALLAGKGRFLLVEGDHHLTPEVTLVRLNGHSEGFQAVRIDDGELAWYGGDLFPTRHHMRPPVNFAYDVSRRDTVAAKLRILSELASRRGRLYFSHDPETPFVTIDQP